MELAPQIKNDSLPEDLWPLCKKCGGELEPWARGPDFPEGSVYQAEFSRYLEYLRGSLDKNTLFLELGVGMMTPMFIKEPFMTMTYQWPDAIYATINPDLMGVWVGFRQPHTWKRTSSSAPNLTYYWHR